MNDEINNPNSEISNVNDEINNPNSEISNVNDEINNPISEKSNINDETNSPISKNNNNNFNNANEAKNSINESNKENEVSNSVTQSEVTAVNPVAKKAKINIKEYLLNQPFISYTLKSGETLSTIARLYESNCNPNSTIKMIKTINNFLNPNDLEINTIIKIPENTIKNGTMYKVVSGDTWFKVAERFYPNYDTDSVMELVVYINNFPNNDLPLGENVFLPKIS